MSVSGFQLETPVRVVGRGFVERRQLLWAQLTLAKAHSWFKQEFIKDKIKIQRMVMGLSLIHI